jgi:hypothetical protein
MNPNKEHIEEGQTELSAETTTNINRVKAALTTEPVDPETAAAFEQAVTQKPAFKAAADLKSEKKKSNPFNDHLVIRKLRGLA